MSPPADDMGAKGPKKFVSPPPAWLSGASKPAPQPPSRPVPDWLPASRPEPASPTLNPPDWLAKVAETITGAETEMPPAVFAPSPEPEAPPALQPEPEEDLFAALRGQTPAPLGEIETPDWLSSASPPEENEPTPSAAPETAMTVPDWLSGTQTPEPEAPLPAPSGDVPDWMADSVPSVSVPREPVSLEAPDWLKDFPSPEPPAGEAAPPPDFLMETAPPPPAPAGGDVPDWMKSAEAPPAAEPPPAPLIPSMDVPDWLGQVAAETPPPPASVDVPDWLDQVAAGTPAPVAPTTPPPAAPSVDVPDWLDQVAAGTPAPIEPTAPAPAAPSMDVPDWLDQIAAAPPSGPAQPVLDSPAQPSLEAPAWLDEIAAGTPPATPPAPAMPVEAPAWLDEIAAGTPPSAPEAAPLPAEPEFELPPAPSAPSGPLSDDLLDWMDEGLGMAASPAATGASEDLLGMSGDLAMPAVTEGEGAEEGEMPAAPGELPEWLRGMRPSLGEAAGAEKLTEQPAQESTLTPEALEEIGDLRFDKILGHPQAESGGTEKIGALKDMAGVIRPEIIFDAQSLKAGQIISDTVVTKEQGRRIEMLQAMLAREVEGEPVAGMAGRALPVVRWLVALILIAVVAVPLLMNISILSPSTFASSEVTAGQAALDALPPDAVVVVAFEYESDTVAEMEPLAGAVLSQIASRPKMRVFAVSTKPTGAAMANRVFEQFMPEPAAESSDPPLWINIGYIPGGGIGVRALAVGNPLGASSPLGSDYLGHLTGLDQSSLADLSPDLIIVLSSSPEDVRNWVEQAGKPLNVPLLVAASAGTAPMAAAYRQSGQVIAVLSSVNDAVALRSSNDQDVDKPDLQIWNGQALGSIAAFIMIVVGGIYYGLAAMRERQEQSA